MLVVIEIKQNIFAKKYVINSMFKKDKNYLFKLK